MAADMLTPFDDLCTQCEMNGMNVGIKCIDYGRPPLPKDGYPGKPAIFLIEIYDKKNRVILTYEQSKGEEEIEILALRALADMKRRGFFDGETID
jgi:hypothetical protein